MGQGPRIVIASGNAGKVREFRQMLEPLALDVVAQGELGVPDADEPYHTFIENALAKARHASRLAGLPAFADDSGICVTALGGAPGVHSARYATDGAADRDTQDARNNRKLIAALEGSSDRRAHYYCVIVYLRHADDPEPIVVEGRWHGEVVARPRGSNGFGYDPYFYVPEARCTAAELDPLTKNRISHRGIALRALVERLKAERA